jgi:hypothetical protein
MTYFLSSVSTFERELPTLLDGVLHLRLRLAFLLRLVPDFVVLAAGRLRLSENGRRIKKFHVLRREALLADAATVVVQKGLRAPTAKTGTRAVAIGVVMLRRQDFDFGGGCQFEGVVFHLECSRFEDSSEMVRLSTETRRPFTRRAAAGMTVP